MLKKMPLMIFLALFTTLVQCSTKRPTPQQFAAVPVDVTSVQHITIQRTIQVTGEIEPWKKSNLGAQIPGKVQKIYVDAGDRVQKGQLLVQMEDAQLIQARVQYELARKDYERMEPLLKEGSISPNQFDKIRGTYEAARAAYELMLANTQIRAPFSGLITTRWMDEGEVFILMPGQAGSPTILTLMQMNPVKISVRIAESDFRKVRPRQKCKITVDVLGEQFFEGEILRVDPAIDPLSRTFGAEIRVDNPQELLRPGMYARVSIETGAERILAVPRAALIRQIGTGNYYAFVVQDEVAVRRDLQVGSIFDEFVEVRNGLRENEQVVIEGQYLLKDGIPVHIASASGTQTK